jgi:hypothetical protein
VAAVKAPTRKKDRPESEVLKECLDALHAAFWPGFFWRQNAGKIQTKAGHWVELGPDGIGDIVGLVPTPHGARIVFVECKKRTGKQRESQAAFQAAVEALGAIYALGFTGEMVVNGVTIGLQTPVPVSLPHGATFPGLG